MGIPHVFKGQIAGGLVWFSDGDGKPALHTQKIYTPHVPPALDNPIFLHAWYFPTD